MLKPAELFGGGWGPRQYADRVASAGTRILPRYRTPCGLTSHGYPTCTPADVHEEFAESVSADLDQRMRSTERVLDRHDLTDEKWSPRCPARSRDRWSLGDHRTVINAVHLESLLAELLRDAERAGCAMDGRGRRRRDTRPPACRQPPADVPRRSSRPRRSTQGQEKPAARSAFTCGEAGSPWPRDPVPRSADQALTRRLMPAAPPRRTPTTRRSRVAGTVCPPGTA